jgi:hypothetical protein
VGFGFEGFGEGAGGLNLARDLLDEDVELSHSGVELVVLAHL